MTLLVTGLYPCMLALLFQVGVIHEDTDAEGIVVGELGGAAGRECRPRKLIEFGGSLQGQGLLTDLARESA